MELAYLRQKWRSRADGDPAASISAWDSVAQDYVGDVALGPEGDEFLRSLRQKTPLTPKMRVLDVGCGAGAYALALASQAAEVVGVDFSPKMIEAARRSAARAHRANVSFLERDWHRCSSEEFRGRFDLAFAHTTPAVADYATLVKMMEASKRYCALCKPARRSDQVFDRIREIAGCAGRENDASVAYAFDTIWGHGYDPEVTYSKAVWESSRTAAEAEKWYLGRLKGSCALTAAAEEEIRRYLAAISVDGFVTERTETTLVNFFWEMNG